MDPTDSFYQQLDSEELLQHHGPDLVADAREILAKNPMARVAGLITLPDSRDADTIRTALARVSGQPLPGGLLVGVVPRRAVEALLTGHVGSDPWQESASERQRVLPIVVCTRDGFRFGFFGLGASASDAAQG